MYTLKYAWKSIVRNKARNLLTFILVLVVAVSACVALNIRSSAELAKESATDLMTVTAQISVDRQNMMEKGMTADKDEIMEAMQTSMSLEELEVYSESEYVSDFYYNESANLDSEEVTAYETTTNNFAGMKNFNEDIGAFTIVGYSSHDAMSTFVSGENIIYDGAVFDSEGENGECVISSEVAFNNDLVVGDNVEFTNENGIINLTISGIFTNESTDAYANQIYVNMDTFESLGLEGRVNGTYVFDDISLYESFNESVSSELDDSYTIISADVTEYEKSMEPIDNLSTFSLYFFIVVLLVGALILIIFNMFSVRERKYEIGVLAAIGMAKGKVAMQFLTEVLIVTFIAITIGTAVGSLISEPVANSLLESQIESVQEEQDTQQNNFGGNFKGRNATMTVAEVDYIESISVSGDSFVIIQLLGMGVLLALIGSSVGMISILKYEPLTILSERT